MSRYTRTIDVPAAAGPQDVTLDAFPAQHTTRLQVTKVPDAGDIWLALYLGSADDPHHRPQRHRGRAPTLPTPDHLEPA